MQCERGRELLSPYIDGELPAEEARAVATHLEECRACAARAAEYRRMGRTIVERGRETPAPSLSERVRSALARVAAEDEPRPAPLPVKGSRWLLASAPLRQAAMIAAACVVTALSVWWLMAATGHEARLEQDLLSAHVRSLLQDSPIQVASSDTHTVKPWFAGRVDFSPDVKDLKADGFMLLGGRLDYVDGRRVGALVYKRRLHTINVFVWPAGQQEERDARFLTRNGYNLLTWTRNGLTYWAVSDLNADELRQLSELM
jgi:anti-sigma factor RsiW